jgi:hypothetical protein
VSARPDSGVAATPLIGARLAAVVRAAHEAIAPPGAPDPVPGLEHVFGDAKLKLRRFLVLSLWLLEVGPLFYRFSRFSRLPLPERTAWIERLRRSKGKLARALYALVKVLFQSMAYDDAR